MAQKEEKKKLKQKQQASANKEAKNSRPWPDLPHQLIKLIASQPSLEQGINFGIVTKSWRAAPKKCINPNATLPWLQIFNTYTHQCKMTKPCNSDDPFQGFWISPAPWVRHTRYPWKHYLGCTNGILVAKGATCNILWNPIRRSWYNLPLWDARFEFKCFALSSSLGNKNVIVMALTGTSHPAFMFHRLGIGGEKFEWIKQDCSLVDPHATDKSQKHYMQFTNVIGFRGKFYALTLQGTLAVIEEVDSHLKITSLATKRAIPSVSSRHFREYLVESNGEILLIFLISKKSVNVVDDVEVFGLDFVRLSWIKTESLGDQTLFVGDDCCVSVSARNLGCKSNCLYFHFTHNANDGWWLMMYENRQWAGQSLRAQVVTCEAKELVNLSKGSGVVPAKEPPKVKSASCSQMSMSLNKVRVYELYYAYLFWRIPWGIYRGRRLTSGLSQPSSLVTQENPLVGPYAYRASSVHVGVGDYGLLDTDLGRIFCMTGWLPVMSIKLDVSVAV